MNSQFNNGEILAGDEKIVAALGYVLFFIPLIAKPGSSFARFHANQGLLLFILSIVGWFIAGILSIIGGLISMLTQVVVFVLFILGIINAVNGQRKALPVIGGIQILK